MTILQILILALIQGAAELLPVSSSAHVIVAEKLMGLNPSSPEMTFLLVMLHTGTMLAVIAYFWKRWKNLLYPLTLPRSQDFLKGLIIATLCTGVVGVGLKTFIEKVILHPAPGMGHAEIEELFKSLPLIGTALLVAGILIVAAGLKKTAQKPQASPSASDSAAIGIVQGLCLPFRGFSRSGATISTALLRGVSRATAEDFSFALAVILTPPVVLMELRRLLKHTGGGTSVSLSSLLVPGLIGMAFSFGAGLLALRWLSSWLEKGRWKYFGYYCITAAIFVFVLSSMGF